MTRVRRTAYWVLVVSSLVAWAFTAAAQINTSLYAGLSWRNVGPFHGGRISSVTGVIGQPGVFYMGTPLGGIWKTTSAGVTWFPVFDQVKEVDSIGAVQVAPSNPDIVYAGTGDPISGSLGNGMWKSTDAGKTWQHIGLEDTVKVTSIVVDPTDPNLVLASALGDANRKGGGVYRSTDGGQTWTNVLKPDGYDGVRELQSSFDEPSVMVAATQGTGGAGGAGGAGAPGGGPAAAGGGAAGASGDAAAAGARGPNGGGGRGGRGGRGGAATKPPLVYKSLDEGKTWTEIKIPGFAGRVALAVAMHTKGQRLYIVGNAIDRGSGLFRSDDQGATWKHMAGADLRIAMRISNGQGNYSSGVFVDTQNPDILYTMSTAMYRSTDGGVTFEAFKGAPGGEDYHKLWIDPTNANRMLVGSDQGASVTLDHGATWSLWYNQVISQLYHVATDSAYPYHIMGAQQDTGAVMISSRGTWGQVNFNDWSPLPSSEFGIVRPDARNPNIIYGVGYGAGGGGSGLIKIDMTSGQWQNVAPNFGADADKYRMGRDFQKKFDTVFEPGALYVAYQCLLVSRDGAHSFTAASPDLTTTKDKPQVACGAAAPEAPAPAQPAVTPIAGAAQSNPAAGAAGADATAGAAGPGRGGATATSISEFSLSRVKRGVIWTISSNGQIYNTMDQGKTWTNVSNIADIPGHINLWTIEAGDDANSAYVTARMGPERGQTLTPEEAAQIDVPLIWRTTDGGQTWTKIIDGLPRDERTGSWINSLRADPGQPGLLFAGTETTVYVSFDNGDHWQSLRQNLPSTSIRDLEVHTDNHQNDLVISTYGRGFWVLDDITPLREIAAKAQTISASSVYLFKPQEAIRSRINSNWDQPFSIEVPHAPNVPYGALVDYYLSRVPSSPIQLQVFDSEGSLVRTITSTPPPPIEDAAYPHYWLAGPETRALSTHVGLNRINWNLLYDDPPALRHDLENQMNMVEGSVTPGPHGPQAIPGVYTLRLTVDGKVYTSDVTVVNDPRVGQTPALMADLRAQSKLTLLSVHGMEDSFEGHNEVTAVTDQLTTLLKGTLPDDVAAQAKTLQASLTKIGGATTGAFGGGGGGGGGRGGRGGGAGALQSFADLNNAFNTMVSMMQVGLDMAPTPTQIGTWQKDCADLNRTDTAWEDARKQIAEFNALLDRNKLDVLKVPPGKLKASACSFTP